MQATDSVRVIANCWPPDRRAPRVNCRQCGQRCKILPDTDMTRAKCPKCRTPILEPIPVAELAPVVEAEVIAPPAPVKPTGKLVDLYAPKCLADIAGQEWAHDTLSSFLADPRPGAFLFSGPTGTGKSSAALALAAELGVAVDWCECGGLHQISSGEQDGKAVRETMRGLRVRPMFGNGWRVLIVNECDHMTANAAVTWLDALEDIPPMSVVIFTTNDPGRIPRRLRDRCEEVVFVGGAMLLRAALESLAARVWAEQVGNGPCPDLDTFGAWAVDGEASFRRLLQLMEPHVRAARQGRKVGTAPESPKPSKGRKA